MMDGSPGATDSSDASPRRITSTATIGPSSSTAITSTGRLLSTPPSTSSRPGRDSGGTSPGIDMLAPTASTTRPRRWTTVRLASRSALTVKNGTGSSSTIASPKTRSSIRAAFRERMRDTRGSV